jgi:WS/DGAT/MGAT family acyltransferase
LQTITHLSATDAAFLYLETPEMPMHVASLYHVELPPDYQGDYFEDLKDHLRKRMHVSPIFQRRVETMPLDLSAPVWVECDVDIDYHVRHIILPRPGSLRQLEAYVARLHSSLLDRSRPLWELYLFEGLENGEKAIYTKVHHSALDGMGSIELVKALLDITPVPREVRRSRHRTQRDIHFGVAEMIRAGVTNGLAQTVKTIRVLGPAARSAIAMVKALRAQRAAARDKDDKSGLKLFAPRTPLNVTITNQRVFGTLSLPLAEVKAVGKSVDATINDMVMAICAGGLRRYLRETATLPKDPLVAMMPVSLREKGDDTMTNQVSGLPVSLRTDMPDPMKRMFAIRDSLSTTKDRFTILKDVMINDFPFLGMPWLMSAAASLYGRARLAETLPPFGNVAISNVVGPQMPLYYAGARVKTYYPLSIVTHGLALNITVVSYSGAIHFGFTACRRAMPDIEDFVDDMRTSYEELKGAIERHLRKAADEAAPQAAARGEPAAAAQPAPAALPGRTRPRLAVVEAAEPVARVKAAAAAKAPAKARTAARAKQGSARTTRALAR